ncbi:MAG: orotate phosphoribosyltransferase [Clostridia bacterium]|nr:orotate phosphoribosyltransferase [Clostridia bacterium]
MSAPVFKIGTKHKDLYLRIHKGHFATGRSHINYYIDITTQKSRLSEAKAVAHALRTYYHSTTIVDTILCLDGTEVIGTCLAGELTDANFVNINAHQTIYIITPENTSGNQLIFRDNITPMIQGKHVLVLAASVVTGYTAKAAIEAINYYGGKVVGVGSIFASSHEIDGVKVNSVFDPNDLPDYAGYSSHDCPLCKKGIKLDALVNSFGFSKL